MERNAVIRLSQGTSYPSLHVDTGKLVAFSLNRGGYYILANGAAYFDVYFLLVLIA